MQTLRDDDFVVCVRGDGSDDAGPGFHPVSAAMNCRDARALRDREAPDYPGSEVRVCRWVSYGHGGHLGAFVPHEWIAEPVGMWPTGKGER